ncbi:MAG: Proline dehydrogenase [Nocardia sp.]|uniref:proline dehydrogenase family protein n=1 Tax=Nocardia sp. TaxID=1821 RepID=UPI002601DA3C|nr:proline dehydrogenase family protein [Nocardia sp.]MCU1643220.1 Proline dehydrogenase [Nocardia sp.]
MNPLRPLILAAAGSPRMKRALTATPVTAGVVRRFVAGETRAELAPVVRALLASGRSVSVDFLGEYTTERSMADAAVAEYISLIDQLAELDRAVPVAAGGPTTSPPAPAGAPASAPAEDAVPRVEVSLKLSALGQSIAVDGPAIAAENLHKLCAKAVESRVWVTVDAEDHTTTDDTLAAVQQARAEFPWLAVAMQTYLRTAEDNCRDAAASGTRVRLCKGAYQEPETVAYQRRAEVDASYLRCLDVLLRGGWYPMVASHDPAMIEAALALSAEHRRSPGDFEFQMLYGIRDAEQRRLVDDGHALRVYIPYGTQWYGYLMRRLAERPANIGFFLRALTERG